MGRKDTPAPFADAPMHSAFSSTASAQSERKVFSVSVENKSMSETLDEISRISGYSFFYYDGLFSSARKVTLKTTNLTIRQTLDKLFEGSENTYAIDGQQVFIRRAPAKKQQAPKSETITGWVLDKNNAPVSGATVIVAGTNKGVTSGIQGGFQLSDITLPATLNISVPRLRTPHGGRHAAEQGPVDGRAQRRVQTGGRYRGGRLRNPAPRHGVERHQQDGGRPRTTSVRWPAPDSCSKAVWPALFPRRDRETSARANV